MNIRRKILLSILSVAFCSLCAKAQIEDRRQPLSPAQVDSLAADTLFAEGYGIPSDSVSVKGSLLAKADSVAAASDTTSSDSLMDAKKLKKRRAKTLVERRGMISREDVKNIFIPKGQWMFGGQVAWNQWDNDNLNYMVLKDINFEGYTFSAGPYLGYFFANNLAVGARFSYKRYYIDLGSLDVNLGEDFNIGLKDIYYLQHNYETTAFLRSYLPLGKSKIFGLFGEFQLSYTFSEGKNSTGLNDTYSSTYERVNNFEIGLAGGMVVFFTDYVAAELMLNVGGYHFKWGKQNTNNIEEGSVSKSGANFRINLFSIKFGMTYYL